MIWENYKNPPGGSGHFSPSCTSRSQSLSVAWPLCVDNATTSTEAHLALGVTGAPPPVTTDLPETIRGANDFSFNDIRHSADIKKMQTLYVVIITDY